MPRRTSITMGPVSERAGAGWQMIRNIVFDEGMVEPADAIASVKLV